MQQKSLTKDHQRDFALESIRREIFCIAEQIEAVGYDLTMDQVSGVMSGPSIEMFGKILKGLADAWERTEMQFDREAKAEDPPRASDQITAGDIAARLANMRPGDNQFSRGSANLPNPINQTDAAEC